MNTGTRLDGKALVVGASGGIASEGLAEALFLLSMPQTACPTEITILTQRSPYV